VTGRWERVRVLVRVSVRFCVIGLAPVFGTAYEYGPGSAAAAAIAMVIEIGPTFPVIHTQARRRRTSRDVELRVHRGGGGDGGHLAGRPATASLRGRGNGQVRVVLLLCE
jgi:hypothetical protein